MKRCPRCGATKPLSEYHKSSKRKDGVQSECKSCKCERTAEIYAQNPNVKRLRQERRTAARHVLRLKIVEYLRVHPCVDCGETDPVVLDFDHIRDKEMSISDMVRKGGSWDSVLKEIGKCEVVCANDHRRRTASRAGGWIRCKGYITDLSKMVQESAM